MINFIKFISLTLILQTAFASYEYLPQQIHLSYTNNSSEVMVTWSTLLNTQNSTIKYSPNKPILNKNVTTSNITKFIDGGILKKVQYINRVLLSNLTLDTEYYYICGNEKYGWSDIYKFKLTNYTNNYPKFIAYGDLGDTNSVSLANIQLDIDTKNIDSILHIGDFAYDFATNNGDVGNDFMNDIQSIASKVPYMTAVGNHEAAYNYSHYKNRFTMPNYNNTENMFYSWNIGPVHIISLSTEVYFEPNTRRITSNIHDIQDQFNWLVKDLITANLLENRQKQPWIITMGHRPMYCSNVGFDACTWTKNPVRDGILYLGKIRYGLEDLFYNYNVDLSLWGHEHSYERTYPVYQRIPYAKNTKVVNGTAYYYNPVVPVHIISGSPGNREMVGAHLNFTKNDWSACHSDEYSYSDLEVFNSTHLHITQVNGHNRTVIDDLWIIK